MRPRWLVVAFLAGVHAGCRAVRWYLRNVGLTAGAVKIERNRDGRVRRVGGWVDPAKWDKDAAGAVDVGDRQQLADQILTLRRNREMTQR